VKVARSFFCIFTGWCVAIITLVCWQVFRPGFGYVTDFSFFLSWTALFGFFGWLVFVVPAVLRIEDHNRWLQFPLSLVTGAVYGVVIYLAIVCTWLKGSSTLAWFPAIMGGVAGAAYSLLGKWQTVERARAPVTACFFVAPVALMMLFAFVLWPLVIRHAPYVAYVFGAYESRDQAHLQILRGIHTKDTYTDLHRKYPRVFPEPFRRQTGNGSSYTYSITFDDTCTYVTKVTITDNR